MQNVYKILCEAVTSFNDAIKNGTSRYISIRMCSGGTYTNDQVDLMSFSRSVKSEFNGKQYVYVRIIAPNAELLKCNNLYPIGKFLNIIFPYNSACLLIQNANFAFWHHKIRSIQLDIREARERKAHLSLIEKSIYLLSHFFVCVHIWVSIYF